MSDPATIARGLSEAQQRVVLSLPSDGDFGKADTHKVARYMWWGVGKERAIRLVKHQHCTGNSWCLNDLGLAVRDILMKGQPQ